MKKIVIALVVLIIVGLAAYYIVFQRDSGEVLPVDYANVYVPTNLDTQPEVAPVLKEYPQEPVLETPTSSAPASVIVNIKNFAFDPLTLKIRAGTKVTWVNHDTAPHSVVSDEDDTLNSSTLSSGQSFSVTFNSASNINYHCGIHPIMKGAVIVEK